MSVVANVAINVDSSNAVSKLRQVQTQSQQTERAVEGLSRAFGGLAAAFGAGFALTKVIADVKELDTNLRRLGTVGVDVAKISPALSKLSDELGGVASKAELAAASYQAASAGFSDTAGNINILRAATKAATGGLADTQAVTEVLVKTLNSYGMSGNQAIQVTDSISKAVELGNQEWSDYTSQLGRVASIAALAGVSLDEVNAFIASATKNGATAEIAFTGLGATLNTLLQPTKESQEAAAKLGIAWNYGGLQAKGFTGLMAELAVAMDKDKETTAKLLGSQEAMRGAFAAASKSGSDFKNILGQIGGAAGKTDADFQTMKGSLENTLKALDTSFKNLSEALGTAFGPTVVIVVQDITKAVNSFADFMATVPQPVMNTAGQLVKLIAQMLLLDKALKIAMATAALFRGAMLLLTTQTTLAGAAALTGQAKFLMLSGGIKGAGVAAATATPALVGILGVLLRLAAIGAIAIVINVAVTGMAAVYQAQAEISKLRGERSKGGAPSFGGSATAEQKKVQQGVIAAIQKERASSQTGMASAAAALGIGKTFARQRTDQLTEREASARAILALPTRKGATPRPMPNAMNTPVGSTVGGGGGGRAAGGGGDAKRAADEAARAAEEIRQQVKAADDLNFTLKNRLAIAEITEPVAKRMLEYDIRQNEIAKEYDELKQAAKSADELILINANQVIEQRIAQIEAEQQINNLLAERALLMADVMRQAAMPTVYNELETQEAALQAVLDKYPAIGAAADAAATMATSGISEMIAGTKSAEQVFIEFLNAIADALINTAKQMIAQYIAIAIAKMFAGMGGSGGGNFAPSGPLAAVGNINPMPTSFTPFAEGGFVTGPTSAVIGEGGESEYVIPASKMQSAMSRYSRGARGEGVIAGSGGGSEGGAATAAAGPMVVDVRYSVERINDVEYVTASAFQAGMRQAAQQGAAQGEQRTLRRLQQSPGTRKRVGM